MNKFITLGAFLFLVQHLTAETSLIDPWIESEAADFSLVQVAGEIPNPWSIAFLPDGRFLVTQRSGRLWLLGKDGGSRQEIGGLPEIRAGGQGGLLDVVLHPAYVENGWIYLSHVVAGSGGNATAVSRGHLNGSRLTSVERVFTANRGGRTSRHFGSRLVFDSAGYLYITLGERGEMQRAQDRFDEAGSIVRVLDDGSVPVDNPFGDRIFSYGHRNPQGIIFDPVTSTVWAHEHGAKGGDEINIIRSGENYGWPVITYGTDYNGSKIGRGTTAPGMEQPQIYWDPSIAPSGMAVYTGDLFPAWKGDIFTGALAGQHLRRIRRDETGRITGQEILLKGRIGRIRDVRQGPEGALYLLTDAADGGVYRLEPAVTSPRT